MDMASHSVNKVKGLWKAVIFSHPRVSDSYKDGDKMQQKTQPPPSHSGSPEAFSLTRNHHFKYRMHLRTSTGMKTHECGHGTLAKKTD